MSQGSYKLSDGTNTIAIPASPTADDTTMATQPEVRSVNFTARIGAIYHVTATCTATDPTPVEGRGFDVYVINGTATVGGTAYSTAGTLIRRRFHSGAWANNVYQVSSTFALASHTHTASQISDSTTAGRALLTAADASAQRTSLGLGTAALSASTDFARSIETRTGNFTAVVGGRYITESASVISVTDPTGTTAGQSYEVWVGGSGGIQFNGTGTTYLASRFSIRRRYNGSAWVTPSPVLSDALQVGTSNTWNGSTFTGAQAFSSTTRPTSAGTGTPASDSLITLADGDARFGRSFFARCTANTSSTTNTYVAVTGCTGIVLKANTNYRIEAFGWATSTAAGGIRVALQSNQVFGSPMNATSRTPSVTSSTAGINYNPTNFAGSVTGVILAERTNTTQTAAGWGAVAMIRTGANAPTVELAVANTDNAGTTTTTVLEHTTLIITEIP